MHIALLERALLKKHRHSRKWRKLVSCAQDVYVAFNQSAEKPPAAVMAAFIREVAL